MVLAAAALGLSGCGDSGAPPQALPSLTSSATPHATATPTSSAPELQRSAEQFVRDYARELDRANHASDPSVLERDYYLPGCRACRYDIGALNRFRSNGQHIEGYRTVLEDVDADEMVGNTVRVAVVLRSESGRVVDRSGKTVENLAATGSLKNDVIVARAISGWRIAEIVPLGEAK
jgi:hypothetical protein